MNAWEFYQGISKIRRSLCPECNSDAPEIDTCKFCDGSREYPLSDKTKEEYRERWRIKRLIMNTPTDQLKKFLKNLMEL